MCSLTVDCNFLSIALLMDSAMESAILSHMTGTMKTSTSLLVNYSMTFSDIVLTLLEPVFVGARRVSVGIVTVLRKSVSFCDVFFAYPCILVAGRPSGLYGYNRFLVKDNTVGVSEGLLGLTETSVMSLSKGAAILVVYVMIWTMSPLY